MNDTMGPEGLEPSLLVYGIVPRYATAGLNAKLPKNRQRHEATKIARGVYLAISNNLRIKRALRSKVPESSDLIYAVGDKA